MGCKGEFNMDGATITQAWMKFFVEMIVLSLTGIAATITVLLRKRISDGFISFAELLQEWKNKKGNEVVPIEQVKRDIRIYDILADLRNKTGSDRSFVFQFHNGSVFTTRNHVWKITRTHESVNTGIKPCIGEMGNMISSGVHELLLPLWDTDLTNRSGISKISPDNCGCTSKDNCNFPHGVYLYNVDKMTEGYVKGLLMAAGVQYLVTTPLLDSESNRIGFIGLDFCWKEANINVVKSSAEFICKAATIISYELKRIV